jgi:hypothetical protein
VGLVGDSTQKKKGNMGQEGKKSGERNRGEREGLDMDRFCVMNEFEFRF